ncbi:sialidase-like [Bufo bufo]|uniref:sialidase-like n=1 Tax=Bufo bufo TaxID=8384 RepID=UPI001ABE33B1|nr:sialidase-like [Bufo bufo]
MPTIPQQSCCSQLTSCLHCLCLGHRACPLYHSSHAAPSSPPACTATSALVTEHAHYNHRSPAAPSSPPACTATSALVTEHAHYTTGIMLLPAHLLPALRPLPWSQSMPTITTAVMLLPAHLLPALRPLPWSQSMPTITTAVMLLPAHLLPALRPLPWSQSMPTIPQQSCCSQLTSCLHCDLCLGHRACPLYHSSHAAPSSPPACTATSALVTEHAHYNHSSHAALGSPPACTATSALVTEHAHYTTGVMLLPAHLLPALRPLPWSQSMPTIPQQSCCSRLTSCLHCDLCLGHRACPLYHSSHAAPSSPPACTATSALVTEHAHYTTGVMLLPAHLLPALRPLPWSQSMPTIPQESCCSQLTSCLHCDLCLGHRACPLYHSSHAAPSSPPACTATSALVTEHAHYNHRSPAAPSSPPACTATSALVTEHAHYTTGVMLLPAHLLPALRPLPWSQSMPTIPQESCCSQLTSCLH